jgi:DNA-binding protein H-NS
MELTRKGEQVNENARATKSKQDTVDLSEFSYEQLEVLAREVARELEERRKKRKHEALEQMREIAKGVGMTPEEILGVAPAGGRRRRGGKRAPVQAVCHPGRSGTGLPSWAEAGVVEGAYRGGQGAGESGGVGLDKQWGQCMMETCQ